MPEAITTLLLDQNVPVAVAVWLAGRTSGWRVAHVNDLGLAGRPDSVIFSWAQEHRAIVITFDEDFADARFQSLGQHCGVVRLRVWPTSTDATIDALERLIGALPADDWAGALIIVDNRRIRIRRPPPAP
jgi:predicted nuclease of predicted toxin-antitoxin system